MIYFIFVFSFNMIWPIRLIITSSSRESSSSKKSYFLKIFSEASAIIHLCKIRLEKGIPRMPMSKPDCNLFELSCQFRLIQIRCTLLLLWYSNYPIVSQKDRNRTCANFEKKGFSKQARKLQATLEGCNPKLWITDWLTDSLTGVKCRATSVAKNRNKENKDDRVKVAAEVALLLNFPFWAYLTRRSPCG